MQDDEGVTTFADHETVHGGKTSLRMENIGKNQYRHCRLAQPLKLQPHRQYHISFWVKTDGLSPADAEVKVLTADAQQLSFFPELSCRWHPGLEALRSGLQQLGYQEARLYLGCWSGKSGKLWWDDLRIEEIGLVNVLAPAGLPRDGAGRRWHGLRGGAGLQASG